MAIEGITFIALVLLIIIFLGRIALSEGHRVEEKKKLQKNLDDFNKRKGLCERSEFPKRYNKSVRMPGHNKQRKKYKQ